MGIDCGPQLRAILRDDALTRGLGDIEARMLVEWVVRWAELLSETANTPSEAQSLVGRVYRRGRGISRFVQLWCDFDPLGRGAAIQLVATERFHWPLPTSHIEPPDLMQRILDWENQHHE